MAVAIRDKVAENSQKFLDPGEQIQAVICAQSASGWLATVPLVSIFMNNYLPVVVTDRRILVLHSGRWSMGNPKEVVRQLPRNIRIGPATGLWWKTTALGDKLYVHARFHKDVVAADAAIGL